MLKKYTGKKNINVNDIENKELIDRSLVKYSVMKRMYGSNDYSIA